MSRGPISVPGLPTINEDSCRLCLCDCSKLNYVVTSEISEYYKKLTDYSINSTDVPKKVCIPCKDLMNSFTRFKRKADEVEAYLAQIMIKMSQEVVDMELIEIPVSPVIKMEDEESKTSAQFSDNQTNSDSDWNLSFAPKQNTVKLKPEPDKKVRGRRRLNTNDRPRKRTVILAPLEELKRPRNCPKCHKIYRSFTERKIHLQAVHSDHNIFTCDICEKTFGAKGFLWNHMKLMHRDKVPCKDCGKYLSPFRIKQHWNEVHRERNLICQFCGKGFSVEVKLKDHLLVFHSTEAEWKYKCKVCGKKVAKRLVSSKTFINFANFPFSLRS